MGMKYAEEAFNMVFFFPYQRRPSKWLHFQTLNTHIRAFLYWSRPWPGSHSTLTGVYKKCGGADREGWGVGGGPLWIIV